MRGEGWEILLDVSRGGSTVRTTSSGVLVSLGLPSIGAASGTGFMPGTVASVWLFSEPVLMATVTVTEDGTFASDFLIDASSIAPVEHTLQVQGVGQDRFIKAVSLGVVVAPESVLLETVGEAAPVDGRRHSPGVILALLVGLVLATGARPALRGRRSVDSERVGGPSVRP